MTTKDFIFEILLVISFVLFGFIGGIKSNLTNHKIIAECERELPRNQSCVVVAVPMEREK